MFLALNGLLGGLSLVWELAFSSPRTSVAPHPRRAAVVAQVGSSLAIDLGN